MQPFGTLFQYEGSTQNTLTNVEMKKDLHNPYVKWLYVDMFQSHNNHFTISIKPFLSELKWTMKERIFITPLYKLLKKRINQVTMR